MKTPFLTPSVDPFYTQIDERYVYEAVWDGKPYDTSYRDITYRWRALQMGQEILRTQPVPFNWVVKRHPCLVASGDLPRFALLENLRNDSLAPPFLKMGDLRIRVSVGGESFWLDERGRITVRFYAWGTVHRVEFGPQIPLTIEVETLLIETYGLAVQVVVKGLFPKPTPVEVGLYYGGLGLTGPIGGAYPECFRVKSPGDEDDDQIEITRNEAILRDPAIPHAVRIAANAAGILESAADETIGVHRRACCRYKFEVGEKESQPQIRLIAQALHDRAVPLVLDQFDRHVQSAKDYYRDLLQSVEIATPDRVLNSGFYTAMVNFDYDYTYPGWLEAVHGWSCYYTDNYHISSAIALGQIDRAREALLFFGEHPLGPGHVHGADGSAQDLLQGGLPYYILQLYRYWVATGDVETVRRVWAPTIRNLERLLAMRDPEGNQILNWDRQANNLLNQMDHLDLPGDAASPTLITAGTLENLAEMAEAIGEAEGARKWRRLASYMNDEVLRRFWLPAEGRLAGAISTRGHRQQGSCITDFFYPALYTSLPREYAWLCLQALDRTLWVGDHLISIGNFQPEMFGSNGIHPAIACEAAAAYFLAGRPTQGWALLYGAAFSSTVWNESPGSFPEFCTKSGFGILHKVYGSAIAYFLQAVVNGLFGLLRTKTQKPLDWHPSIPAEWPQARLRVTGIVMAAEGVAENRTYRLELETAQAMDGRFPLFGQQIDSVTGPDGQALAYKLEAHPSGGFVRVHLAPALRHELTIRLREPSISRNIDLRPAPGSTVEWDLGDEGLSISDPQGMLEEFRIQGSQLTGKIRPGTGHRTIFLNDPKRQREEPIDFDLGAPPPEIVGPLILTGQRQPVPLQDHFNRDFISARNFWGSGPLRFNLQVLVENGTGLETEPTLAVGSYRFQVRPTGKNMVVIDVGHLDEKHHLVLSDVASTFSIKIDQRVNGIEFLTASEAKIRWTRMEIGHIAYRYADGFSPSIPLIYGKNIDCAMAPFATDVISRQAAPPVKEGELPLFLAAWAIPADETRELKKIEIRLVAEDANLGILAMNLVDGRSVRG